MTFEKFATAVKAHKPEIESITRHLNGSGRVDVQFKGSTKVYSYNGSYIQILNTMHIKAITLWDLNILKDRLKDRKEKHGKPDLFWNDGSLVDYSIEIAGIEEELEYYKDAVIID